LTTKEWRYKLNCVNSFPNNKKGVSSPVITTKLKGGIRPIYQAKDLTKLPLNDLWKEVKGEEEWWGEIGEGVQGSCFTNAKSVNRIIYGVINHLNKSWKDKPLPNFTQNS
jgi:hypothetical protein